MTGRWLAATAALSMTLGCEAVPSLTFEEAGGGDTGEAGDAGDAQGTSDAGTGCQRTPRPTACCNGLIPCYGDQCLEAGACSACSMCHYPDRCCPKNGMLGCVSLNSPMFCP